MEVARPVRRAGRRNQHRKADRALGPTLHLRRPGPGWRTCVEHRRRVQPSDRRLAPRRTCRTDMVLDAVRWPRRSRGGGRLVRLVTHPTPAASSPVCGSPERPADEIEPALRSAPSLTPRQRPGRANQRSLQGWRCLRAWTPQVGPTSTSEHATPGLGVLETNEQRLHSHRGHAPVSSKQRFYAAQQADPSSTIQPHRTSLQRTQGGSSRPGISGGRGRSGPVETAVRRPATTASFRRRPGGDREANSSTAVSHALQDGRVVEGEASADRTAGIAG